jgi:four helix bundle protein
MSIEDLKERLMLFGLRVIRMTESLPRSRAADVIGRQLIRCATSVGADYRAACRARSKADFIAKRGIVEEECDESLYWMEVLARSGLIEERLLSNLVTEANEILSIIVASIKTARTRR